MKHFFWGLGTLFFGWLFVFIGAGMMTTENSEVKYLIAIALAIIFVGGVLAILLSKLIEEIVVKWWESGCMFGWGADCLLIIWNYQLKLFFMKLSPNTLNGFFIFEIVQGNRSYKKVWVELHSVKHYLNF